IDITLTVSCVRSLVTEATTADGQPLLRNKPSSPSPSSSTFSLSTLELSRATYAGTATSRINSAEWAFLSRLLAASGGSSADVMIQAPSGRLLHMTLKDHWQTS